MEYKRCGQIIVVRLDRGEELLEQVRNIALEEQVRLAQVNALGALSECTVGAYKLAEKKYYSADYRGDLEIVSLTGSINTMSGEFYCHLHMSAADVDGRVIGGHLNRAVVGATCEMFINIAEGAVDRRYDEEIGLNLLCFDA